MATLAGGASYGDDGRCAAEALFIQYRNRRAGQDGAVACSLKSQDNIVVHVRRTASGRIIRPRLWKTQQVPQERSGDAWRWEDGMGLAGLLPRCRTPASNRAPL